MSSDYLHPDQEIHKHGDNLPHWQQGEVMQFVTFRLGDALPQAKIRHWQEQKRLWVSTYPKPWDAETERIYHRRFTSKLEAWLDQGSGACLLEEPSAREVISNVLMRFQNERVEHHAWVIMPNHVHLLFKPLVPIETLIQAWKSISALKIGHGPIWQRNYRDTMIRDEDHFINAVRYIRKNPVKAKLPDGTFTIWQSERAANVS